MKLNTENFIKYECENDLFNRSIRGFKYWGFIRFELYMLMFESIKSQLDVENDNQVIIKKRNIFYKIKTLLFFLSSINSIPVFFKKKDILLFRSKQRSLINNKMQCRFTFPISNHYSDEYLNIITDVDYNSNKNIRTDRYNMNFIELIVQLFTFFPIVNSKFYNELRYEVDYIVYSVFRYFSFKLNYNYLYKKIIKSYKIHFYYYKFYTRFLTKIRPKCIIYEYHYFLQRMTMNEVATKLGIITIELQHGVMGKGHIAYNYGDECSIELLPNKVYFWGQYWKDSSRIPISDDNKVIVGYPYHDNQLNKYTNNIKDNDINILVISEANYSQKFIKIIEELVSLLEKNCITFKMIYRLHPLEYNVLTDRFENIIKHNNVVLSATLKDNLYFQLSNSNFVIGMSSTVLYEATSYNSNILIMNDKNYYEYSEPLIKNYGAKYFNDSDELYNQILYFSKCTKNYNNKYFFESNSIDKMICNIDSILNK